MAPLQFHHSRMHGRNWNYAYAHKEPLHQMDINLMLVRGQQTSEFHQLNHTLPFLTIFFCFSMLKTEKWMFDTHPKEQNFYFLRPSWCKID